MAQSSHEIENRIENAINTYQHDQSQKLAKIAHDFQVPYQRLLQHVHRTPSKHSNQPGKPILNKEQKETLKDWIIHLDDTHYAPTVKQIEGCANAILVQSHKDPSQSPKVSKMWPYHFIKELPLEF